MTSPTTTRSASTSPNGSCPTPRRAFQRKAGGRRTGVMSSVAPDWNREHPAESRGDRSGAIPAGTRCCGSFADSTGRGAPPTSSSTGSPAAVSPPTTARSWPRTELVSSSTPALSSARTLEHAVETVPHYGDAASPEQIRSDPFEALASFPVLSRDVVREQGSRLLSSRGGPLALDEEHVRRLDRRAGRALPGPRAPGAHRRHPRGLLDLGRWAARLPGALHLGIRARPRSGAGNRRGTGGRTVSCGAPCSTRSC